MGLNSPVNVTNDEFDWYTPIAVILKPTSNKDLQKHLPVNFDNQPLPSSGPVWPPVQDTWPFDPLSSNFHGRTENTEQENGDRLREFYQAYNHLLSNLQDNLFATILRKDISQIADVEGQGEEIVQ